MIVNHYAIELQTYHDSIVGRLCFTRDDGTTEESALYSVLELNSMVELWRMDQFLGSFAIGTRLSDGAQCRLTVKPD